MKKACQFYLNSIKFLIRYSKLKESQFNNKKISRLIQIKEKVLEKLNK